MNNELKNNQLLSIKDPKSLEALERIWIEYKRMRFGYWKDQSQEQAQ